MDLFDKSGAELVRETLVHFIMFWACLTVLLIKAIDAFMRAIARQRVARREVVTRTTPPAKAVKDGQRTRAQLFELKPVFGRADAQLPTAELLWADIETLPKEKVPAWLR